MSARDDKGGEDGRSGHSAAESRGNWPGWIGSHQIHATSVAGSDETSNEPDVSVGASDAAWVRTVVPPIRHTGFGDCACDRCYPPTPDYPLADHGQPLGLFGSLWAVLRGVRLYG